MDQESRYLSCSSLNTASPCSGYQCSVTKSATIFCQEGVMVTFGLNTLSLSSLRIGQFWRRVLAPWQALPCTWGDSEPEKVWRKRFDSSCGRCAGSTLNRERDYRHFAGPGKRGQARTDSYIALECPDTLGQRSEDKNPRGQCLRGFGIAIDATAGDVYAGAEVERFQAQRA